MFIVLLVIAAAIAMIAVELRAPRCKWPTVAGWWFRAALLNAFQISSVFLAGGIWDKRMAGASLWSADSLGVYGGAAVGYLVITFFYYWWHRARHDVSFLWRWFHQVHHSPQRIEIVTSFYKHPFEIIVNSILSSAILYLIVGLNQDAAAIAVLLTGFAELFYHWNISTPYWLGFVFQRPESHCVHHQQNLHSYNYSDLPLWDMIFGTFKNPKSFDQACGFKKQYETRLTEMLLGVDVHKGNKKTRSRTDRNENGPE